MQETRRTSTGLITFNDDSLKGWQLVWSGYKRKCEHGAAILMAPHVVIDKYQERYPARIISTSIPIKGMRITILNSYAPTDCTMPEATKAAFYTVFNKKYQPDLKPKFKVIAIGDINATISSHSKKSGMLDVILGCNNFDRVETDGNGERLLGWCLKHTMIINS